MTTMRVTCKNKTNEESAYIMFIIDSKGKRIKEKFEVPVANIRHRIVVAEDEWKDFYEKKLQYIIAKYDIPEENVKSFADSKKQKESYEKDLATRRKEYGLSEVQLMELRNKKKRLSEEREREYQRLYKREYRRIQKMRENNPNTELSGAKLWQ